MNVYVHLKRRDHQCSRSLMLKIILMQLLGRRRIVCYLIAAAVLQIQREIMIIIFKLLNNRMIVVF